MTFFRRNKNEKKSRKVESSRLEKSGMQHETAHESADSKPRRDDPLESSPQRVGIVSGVLSTPADSDGLSRFGSVVERCFGPDPEPASERKRYVAEDGIKDPSRNGFTKSEALRAVEPLLDEYAESPKLELDPMAHVGHATTIMGDIVAGEDLEIQGTIEGSVRCVDHRVTVASNGTLRATVEAHTVLVIGKITGNVVATELVEIKTGGVIEGDVKAPRVIMNDGAIVVGELDMSAALSRSTGALASEPPMPAHPRLIRVELPDDPSMEKDGI
jgi:cytoskeletal protein CcmA (bactofilin family)